MISLHVLSYIGLVLVSAGCGAAMVYRGYRYRASRDPLELAWVALGLPMLTAFALLLAGVRAGSGLLVLVFVGTVVLQLLEIRRERRAARGRWAERPR